MNEPQAPSDTVAKSQSEATPTFRLVIRAEIIPEQTPRVPVRQHWNRRALVLVLAAIALLLLSWAGIHVFRTDPTSTSPVSEKAPDVGSQLPAPTPSQAAPVVGVKPPANPTTSTATESVEPRSTEANSVEPHMRGETDASPSPVKEVLPDIPRSALQTIRGTIRVSVRVTVDTEGTVVAATANDPGPSRYFERLAIETSKKWTFARANTAEQRTVLLQFNFTRRGTTARVSPSR